MRKFTRFLVPTLLGLLVVASIFWYLFVYDRAFTRDFLLREARINDERNHAALSSWFYKLAYAHSGNDEEVALELAQQYRADRKYTRAEVYLSKAISASPSVELYSALCGTYAEQDKLKDCVTLLAGIPDAGIRATLDAARPSSPTPSEAPGFYNTYANIALSSSSGTIYYSLNGEYPSISGQRYTEPIQLPLGETVIQCISVDEQTGLVSPLSVLVYTVGGVVEEVSFMDSEIELALRNQLGMTRTELIYSNDLWAVKEFTVPAQTWTLEDLSMLTHLESLTIPYLPSGSLQDLSSLTELRTLDLTGCRFAATELEVLAKLPHLQKLVLTNCGLSTIAGLEGSTSLTSLDLSNNTIRNLEPLQNMVNLQELYLKLNAVVSLDALIPLYNLEKLDISFNAVSTLAPLAQCSKLSWLDASNNTISSVSEISGLRLLTTLSLNYNNLSDISPLGACTQLRELSFTNNQVYNLADLNTLANLEMIDFSYNNIPALPAWPQSSALRVVQGSHNKVNSIYVLSGMANLTYVSMDYNDLSDISSLANCPNLVQVNVYGNPISDVSELTSHSIIVNYDPTMQ